MDEKFFMFLCVYVYLSLLKLISQLYVFFFLYSVICCSGACYGIYFVALLNTLRNIVHKTKSIKNPTTSATIIAMYHSGIQPVRKRVKNPIMNTTIFRGLKGLSAKASAVSFLTVLF